jgi:hypothetical protein
MLDQFQKVLKDFLDAEDEMLLWEGECLSFSWERKPVSDEWVRKAKAAKQRAAWLAQDVRSLADKMGPAERSLAEHHLGKNFGRA